tara:strand:+ start:50 stop:190 length:141 start_codon:yes stop_codon:yes gene_type:complete
MRIEQDNGNTQLNSIRNEFNDRTKAKNFMGSGLRNSWNERRRFRTI